MNCHVLLHSAKKEFKHDQKRPVFYLVFKIKRNHIFLILFLLSILFQFLAVFPNGILGCFTRKISKERMLKSMT